MSILQTTELKKYYGSKPNITKALDGVTLSIEDGEFVAIVGTSGSGKSTLLNMMGGLDTPTSGSIKVKGKELSKFKDEQLTIFRRRNIGFIFQNYNLVPVLNVYENIVLPVELDGDTVDKHFMNEVVKMLALDEKLNSMPNNLSGGQQQRVAIARALVSKPATQIEQLPNPQYIEGTSRIVLEVLSDLLPSGQAIQLADAFDTEGMTDESIANAPYRWMGYSLLVTFLTSVLGIALFRKREIR